MGSILLAVVSDLQAFNFHDTFTDPFEVGLLQLTVPCYRAALALQLPLAQSAFAWAG